MADNAVKIGLGALITIVGGWITLKLTHCHEIRKDAIAQRLRDIDKKTDRYIDFLSSSQTLMQKYLYESCDPGSEDYTNYMRLHNIVSLTSSPELRIYAFDTQSKVSQFILLRKPNEPEVIDVKWHTEFGHLNRGDMLTSEQHRCSNEKKKFQRRV